MIHFHIVTLFPESIEPYLQSSILGRASKGIAPKGRGKSAKGGSASGGKNGKPLIKVSYYDPKNYTRDKYGRVDRRPYGGGPGMVLEPEGILRAVEAAHKKIIMLERGRGVASAKREPRRRLGRVEVVFFSTDGAVFDEAQAQKLAKKDHIILICGRYEGIDARVQKILKAKPVSVGPYVLTGGELPAATLVDAISRFVPGILGKAESLERSRVSSPEVYTRPDTLVWKKRKYKVPQVLLSGNHAKIDAWKKKRSSKVVSIKKLKAGGTFPAFDFATPRVR